jgi:pimeloyl-ACP methyl ester carboxylesterase
MFTLFLPGSFRRSSDYVWLSNCLAHNSDFYTVDYPVSTTVAKLNSEFYSSDCMLQVRRELIYGSQSISDSRLSIAYEDSVMGSFLEQVRERHGNSISDHEILSHTLVVGHSQGAGHAAVLAIDHSLNGVLLISGPADSYQHVPSSWTGIRARTSRSHVKMFIHAEDRHSRMCLYHSTLLGLNNISVLTELSKLEDVIFSQVVIDTRPLPPLKSHDCLTFDSEKLDDFNKLYLSTVIAMHKSLSSDLLASTLSSSLN